MSDISSQENSRRQFIKSLSIVAIAIPALSIIEKRLGGTSLGRQAQAGEECEWCGAMDAPTNPPSRIVIPPPGEAGEPLIISGKVYKEDGRTPAAGILIYAYHTNAAGIYPRRTPDNGRAQWRHGYLRGWMKTGVDGKYEFRTIKPAPYPGRTEPAHIHLTMSAANYPEHSGTIWFADDPLITPELRGRNNVIVATRSMHAAAILTLRRGLNGVLRGTHDIRLRRFTS